MAFYIIIRKSHESELWADYIFEGDQGRRGVLSFNKATGESSLIEPMPGDDNNHFYCRAAVKVAREWRSGKLPDVMEWAS